MNVLNNIKRDHKLFNEKVYESIYSSRRLYDFYLMTYTLSNSYKDYPIMWDYKGNWWAK